MPNQSTELKLYRRRFLSATEIALLKRQIDSGDFEPSYKAMRLLWEYGAWRLLVSQTTWHIHFHPTSPAAYAYWASALNHLGSYDGAAVVTARALEECDEGAVYFEFAKLFLMEGDYASARLCFDQSLKRPDRLPKDSFPPLTLEQAWRIFLRHHQQKTAAKMSN